MGHKNILFQRLQQQISRHDFESICGRYFSRESTRVLSHKNHFMFLMYCVLNQVKSLREGVENFNHNLERLYHLGFTRKVSLSTVSEANSRRTSDFYKELFFHLQRKMSQQIKRKLKLPLKILDSTTIVIDDKRVSWARYNSKKNGVKVHLLLEQENILPDKIDITNANVSDIAQAKKLEFEKGIMYVMDRGYFDTKWLYKQHQKGAFFVIRIKKNINHTILKTNPVNNGAVIEEKIIHLMGDKSKEYGEHLRMITILDERKNEKFDVITNHQKLSAVEIAQIYKKRWAIELFFKWLKQNLKIRKFIGLSENAVRLQIWIALITYLLLMSLYQKGSHLKQNFLEFIRLIKARLFLPDPAIRFRKWKEKTDPQTRLFGENLL